MRFRGHISKTSVFIYFKKQLLLNLLFSPLAPFSFNYSQKILRQFYFSLWTSYFLLCPGPEDEQAWHVDGSHQVVLQNKRSTRTGLPTSHPRQNDRTQQSQSTTGTKAPLKWFDDSVLFDPGWLSVLYNLMWRFVNKEQIQSFYQFHHKHSWF